MVKVFREGRSFVLQRNNRPYFIKGAVGTERLEALVAAGGNSIRAGGEALDRAQELGLTVLVNLSLGSPRQGFDYSNEEQVNRQANETRLRVLRYRRHPALLMWALGNELEIGTTPEQRVVMWKEINRLALMIRELDGYHPVITVIGDAYRQMVHELDQYAPTLDAVGLNSYADMLTLPEDLAKQKWTRPYVVTEFGPQGHWQVQKTPWGSPIEETSTEKAQSYLTAYRHSVEGRPRCLGSYSFHWDPHHEKTHTWYGMFLDDGSRLGAVDTMTYLWTRHWPLNRCPRIAQSKIRVVAEDAAWKGPAGVFAPGSRIRAKVDTYDPDADPFSISWELRQDVSDAPQIGGDPETPTPVIFGAAVSARKQEAVIQLPDRPGKYRIFVYVRDDHGGAATANQPILLKNQ